MARLVNRRIFVKGIALSGAGLVAGAATAVGGEGKHEKRKSRKRRKKRRARAARKRALAETAPEKAAVEIGPQPLDDAPDTKKLAGRSRSARSALDDAGKLPTGGKIDADLKRLILQELKAAEDNIEVIAWDKGCKVAMDIRILLTDDAPPTRKELLSKIKSAD